MHVTPQGQPMPWAPGENLVGGTEYEYRVPRRSLAPPLHSPRTKLYPAQCAHAPPPVAPPVTWLVRHVR